MTLAGQCPNLKSGAGIGWIVFRFCDRQVPLALFILSHPLISAVCTSQMPPSESGFRAMTPFFPFSLEAFI